MGRKTASFIDIRYLILFIFCLPILYSCRDCLDTPCYYSYLSNKIIPNNDVKNNIKYVSAKKFNNIGKISKFKNYILISESLFGLHVIDYSNPNKLEKIGFIRLPFNEDIIIQDNTLYSYRLNEILSLDISNIKNPKINYFYKIDDKDLIYKSSPRNQLPDLEIGYEIKKIQTFKKSDSTQFLPYYNAQIQVSDFIRSLGYVREKSFFSIADNYLYFFSNFISSRRKTKVYDITDKISETNLPIKDLDKKDFTKAMKFKDKLFLLSPNSTEVYDNVSSNDINFVSQINNFNDCNGAVIENDNAYISGKCLYPMGERLDIIDLSNLKETKYIRTYSMTAPEYLSIKDNLLFSIDKTNYVKIYDVKDPYDIKLIKEITINKPKEIIIDDNFKAIIISEDGIYQYDFSNLKNNRDMKQLSFMKIEKDDYFKSLKSEDQVVLEGDIYYYKWYKEYFSDK